MTQSKGTSLQIQFLNRIKTILSPDKSIAYELSELLGISTDSVYRRLRGETWLTTEEISVLCHHFNISFDIVSESTTGRATFQYSLLMDVDGYMAHWVNMLNDLKQIAAANKKQIVYAAVDIPVFHHFNYPELASFKLFYWMREVMNAPMLKDSVFELDWILPELIARSREIYTTYCQIPSVEIWTDSTVNSLLKQLEYYWEMGLFKNRELALLVVDRAIEEFEVISKQAELGSKTPDQLATGPNFQFYHSDIEIGNNCVYVQQNESTSVYMGFLTFNTMVTTNPAFCHETDLWLTNIMRKSTLISGIAQKQRYQFFRNIARRFETLRAQIQEN
jgi:hypothetical protein